MTDDDLWKRIRDADEKSQWATLLELCLSFEQQSPEHLQVRIIYAEALTKLSRFPEAKALLLRTYDHPNATILHKYQCQCALGHGFTEIGRLDDARAAYEIAHRLRPEKETALIYLGALELRFGNFVEARNWLNRALNCPDANLDEAHFNLGSTYLAEQDYLKAIEHYQKAVQADPDYQLAKDFLEDAKTALAIQNNSNS